ESDDEPGGIVDTSGGGNEERNWQERTDNERIQVAVVQCSRSKLPRGANETPNGRSSEEDTIVRADQKVFLADDQARDGLHVERGARRHLHIVTELQVHDERQGGIDDLDRGTRNRLYDQIDGNTLTSDRKHETTRQEVNHRDDQRERHGPHGHTRRPNLNGHHDQHEEANGNRRIPTVGNLGILAHQLGVNIIFLCLNLFDTVPNSLAVIEDRVGEDTRCQGKREEVNKSKRAREIQGAILVVPFKVERVGRGIKDGSDIILVSKPIKRRLATHGQISKLPDLKSDGEDEPVQKRKAEENVHLSPPGNHERGSNPSDLSPIKGDETHAKSADRSKQLQTQLKKDKPWNKNEGKKVFMSVHMTRLAGHTMLAGHTRNCLAMPANPSPVIWVAIKNMSSHPTPKGGGDIGHHVNQNMLLDIERTRIKTERSSTEKSGENRPMGYATSKTTSGVRSGEGYRKLKKVFIEMAMMQSNMPQNHIRNVIAGISGSSVFDTDARTSAYGESSSSSSIPPASSVYFSVVAMSMTDVFISDDTRRLTPGELGAYDDENETLVDGKSTRTSLESAERVNDLLLLVAALVGFIIGIGAKVVGPTVPGLTGMGRMLYAFGPKSLAGSSLDVGVELAGIRRGSSYGCPTPIEPSGGYEVMELCSRGSLGLCYRGDVFAGPPPCAVDGGSESVQAVWGRYSDDAAVYGLDEFAVMGRPDILL
ncbi:4190_t:CDS:10, partial [Acaulospora colombiana]